MSCNVSLLRDSGAKESVYRLCYLWWQVAMHGILLADILSWFDQALSHPGSWVEYSVTTAINGAGKLCFVLEKSCALSTVVTNTEKQLNVKVVHGRS